MIAFALAFRTEQAARRVWYAAAVVARVWLAVDAWLWLADYTRALAAWIRSGCDLMPEYDFTAADAPTIVGGLPFPVRPYVDLAAWKERAR